MRGRIPAIKASSVIYLVIYRKKEFETEREREKKKERGNNNSRIIARKWPNRQIGTGLFSFAMLF